MTRKNTLELYFEWMCKRIDAYDRFMGVVTYDKLLRYLNSVEFTYELPMDSNREVDGEDLRYHFDCASGCDIYEQLRGLPCSILEMMVALAIKCEDQFMSDEEFGDRTDIWFWKMISNLGLAGYTDDNFNEEEVEEIIDRFLRREYSPDGKGGLFYMPNCEEDLRYIDIWIQMCWYLNPLVGV